MALIIVPDVDAESYASVAEADAYHSKHGTFVEWDSQVEATKEANLRTASEYLDAFYGTRFKGERTLSEQPFAWPRKYIFLYGATTSLDDEIVPKKIKDAVSYLALQTRTTPLFADQGARVKRERLEGVADTEYFGTNGSSSRLIAFPFVAGLLRDYMTGGMMNIRTARG